MITASLLHASLPAWLAAVCLALPGTDAAAEALFWLGVSRYKRSGDGAFLQQTAEAFKTRYNDSTWAKKASVWEK